MLNGFCLTILIAISSIASMAWANDAAFSPDGNLVAATVNGALTVIDLRTNENYIVDDNGYAPAWHSKSALLVYRNPRQAVVWNAANQTKAVLKTDLLPPYSWRLDGSRITGLLKDEETQQTSIAWHHRQTNKIVLQVPVLNNIIKGMKFPMLKITNTDGVVFVSNSNVFAVINNELLQFTTTSDVLSAGLKKDGRRIFFSRKSANPAFILLSLYTYDTHLRSVQKLPFPERVAGVNSDRKMVTAPKDTVFSPTEDRFLLIGERNGAPVLFTVALNGSSATQVLKTEPSNVIQADWASDGKSFVVLIKSPKGDTLWLYNADGSLIRKLK